MPNHRILDTSAREVAATAARVRFEKETAELVSEGRFGGPDSFSTEAEVMDEAARLVKEARASK
jgi:hypothetical protein